MNHDSLPKENEPVMDVGLLMSRDVCMFKSQTPPVFKK